MSYLKKGLLLATLIFASLANAQSDPTKPVATVNGETISGLEYFRRMEFLPGVGRMVRGEFTETWPGYIAMQQLINERLILQLAKERGVFPKEADVKAELDSKVASNPKLIENLAKVGISKADLENQIRVDLAEFNIITQGITITDLEVEKHYKDNPSRFTIPKRYKLRLIAIPAERKASVEADLAAGKPFADVATKYSTDPSSLQGGSIGEVPANAFSEPVLKVLDATKIGTATDWVQGNTGLFKFYIEDIKPQEKIPLDDNLKKQLRKSLMLDRGRVKNNIEKLMAEMRKKAKIEVVQPGLSDMIKDWQLSPIAD